MALLVGFIGFDSHTATITIIKSIIMKTTRKNVINYALQNGAIDANSLDIKELMKMHFDTIFYSIGLYGVSSCVCSGSDGNLYYSSTRSSALFIMI